MARRMIFLDPDPILRKKSKPVTVFDEKLAVLLDDMAETMYHAKGAGLAAVQVGILRQVAVVDTGEGLIELVNPKITAQSGELDEIEGCLSCPERAGIVTRPTQLTVAAQDRSGNPITIEGTELLARALCHEIDHLHGILYHDLATEMIDIEDQDEDDDEYIRERK